MSIDSGFTGPRVNLYGHIVSFPWSKFAKFLTNDFQGICNKYKVKIHECGINPIDLKLLFLLHYCDVITRQQLRDICARIIKRRLTDD